MDKIEHKRLLKQYFKQPHLDSLIKKYGLHFNLEQMRVYAAEINGNRRKFNEKYGLSEDSPLYMRPNLNTVGLFKSREHHVRYIDFLSELFWEEDKKDEE